MTEFYLNFQFSELREFVRDSFEVVSGFSRPNWKAISAYIATNFADDRAAAWNDASLAWIEGLHHDLGGNYSVVGCERFLPLPELEPATADCYGQFAGSSAKKIKSLLGDAVW